MQHGSGITESAWMHTIGLPIYEPLKYDLNTDVCVIGSGIAGMSSAYHLLRAGVSAVVIDDGRLFSGESSRTTAHLASAIDDGFTQIERIHGVENAQVAMTSHAAAINRIEEIVQLEKIDCDFKRVSGYLASATGDRNELEAEFLAAQRAGFVNIEMMASGPGGFGDGPCIRYPDQGRIHPLKYLAGLAEAILRMGGRIFTGTHAEEIEGGKHAHVVTSTGITIRAGSIIVATNSPVNDKVAIHTKQAPYRSYVIAGCVEPGAVTDALYWDTADPYHYVRLEHMRAEESPGGRAYDLLIIGGEDHKTAQADDADRRFYKLEKWARQHFDQMDTIEFRWSGQVMETIDGLAFIGRNPLDEPNVLIATGDSGMGITHGTIAGILLSDIIQGRNNPWQELYDPSRVRFHSITKFAIEQANVFRQYSDYFTAGEVEDVNDILPGTGAVMRSGLSKMAVYRDEQGDFHEFSAVCPHMKCILRWNSLENSWDCPCHGSRFDAYGHVINGPANQSLTAHEHAKA